MRILLVCLDNLGDLVFTSSLVEPLKEKYPAAQWSILCKDYAAAIARCFPVEANVVSADPWWDGSPGRGPGPVTPFLQAIAGLRRWCPDIAVVTSTNWRASAVARAIGSPVRVGFGSKKSKIFLTHAAPVTDWNKVQVTRQLAGLLEPFGPIASVAEPPVKLVLPAADDECADVPPDPFIVLHPFAGDVRRCWPLSNWGSLAQRLRDTGHLLVWMGRADEVGQIRSAVPESASDRFMQTLSRGELMGSLAITSRAKLLIGHDSGPIHFAAALGVPVLGLYLPSEFPRTVSRGAAPHEVIVRESPGALPLEDIWTVAQRMLLDL